MVEWSRAAARRLGSLRRVLAGWSRTRTHLVERARGNGRLPRSTGRRDRRRRAVNAAGIRRWLAGQHRRTTGPGDRLAGPPHGELVQPNRRADRQLVRPNGLPVDAMFSAPKMRWLLDHLPTGVPVGDVRLGTVDSWLIWRLTGGAEHLCEPATPPARCCTTSLRWTGTVTARRLRLPATAVPAAVASDQGFGMTSGVPLVPDGRRSWPCWPTRTALFGHGCTEVGTAKATYGTGSSVMAPVAELSTSEARYRRPWPGSSTSPRPTPSRKHLVLRRHAGVGG